MKKIYFSPSDQDRNMYAAGNTNEAEQCRKIALACVEAAKRCGFDAKTNTTDEMEDRVEESNRWGADIHVCIHTNAFNGSVMGTRLFCYSKSGEGYKACERVMAALAPITPGESDSITENPKLYETRNTSAVAVYVEVGFHDNVTEAAWIISHTTEIAEAIVRGLCDYYSVAYVEPRKEEPAAEKTVYNTLDEVPGYAKATIEKLMGKDLLVGTGSGLKLSEDMIRVFTVLDRAGLFG